MPETKVEPFDFKKWKSGVAKHQIHFINAALRDAIERAQDLHLCAVVDHLRAAQMTLRKEARERLNINSDAKDS